MPDQTNFLGEKGHSNSMPTRMNGFALEGSVMML